MQDDFEKKVLELKRINQEDHLKEMEDEEAELFLDELVEMIDAVMPETIYLVENKERYAEVMKLLQDFIDIVRQDDQEAKITVKPDELFGTSLCCEIECAIFDITEMKKFCKALKIASSFEVCPLANGNVYISISYDDVYRLAPQQLY